MSKKYKPTHSEHIFRPVHEIDAAFAWTLGSIATPLTSLAYTTQSVSTLTLGLSGIMGANALRYTIKSLPRLNRQMKLSVNRKEFMDVSEVRKINRVDDRFSGKLLPKDDPRETYFGNGFSWGSEHAKSAYQILDFDSEMSEVKLPFLLKPYVRSFQKETRDLGGLPWIHGMGNSVRQMVEESNWYGHALITGNVGTGKTTALKLLSINALHMGNVLIVLDPKNDTDWKRAIKDEMRYMGIENQFYHIHPAKQSKSARIPLLKHYTRISEIADRVAPLVGGTGSGKTFQDFAYNSILNASKALSYLGDPIRLTTLRKAVTIYRRDLALRVFNKYYTETLGENWEVRLSETFAKLLPLFKGEMLDLMADYYKTELAQKHRSQICEDMIEFALHDESHYSKMVTSLKPILSNLTTEPLDDLFSPIDDPESDDQRPIVDLKTIMETGGCVYISLDSLTDSETAGYLSRLVLAECAAIAGERYNSEDLDVRRVTIANDEVHASIENNNALLNLLAQGRAAAIQMILATQTISDLEAKTDTATANRFLGLCNNFISMRTTDPKTQEYVTKQFAKTSIDQIQYQKSSGTQTHSSLFEFSGSYGERTSKMREDAFPEDLLGQLPKLQSVARLADGRKLKMKVPIILNKNPNEVAVWVR